MSDSSDGSSALNIKTHSITDDYIVLWKEKLGTGITGPVRPCIKKDTRERFALKCLMDGPKAHTEVKLHRLCSDHPNIVQVLDVYANDVLFPGDPHPKARLLMVMEFMEGGELFDRISKESGFTERKAAKYLRDISQAVFRCHSLNVAHRDLKPENLLLKNNSEDAEIKLTDFGFAKVDDGNLQTPHFTPYYVAPQVLEAQKYKSKQRKGVIQTSKPYTYDKSCDMWSIGVILYIMLCGYPPFYSETPSRNITSEMKRKILSGKYEFPEEDWKFISEAAKDVVRRLLHVDPSRRMDVQELMSHPWLTEAPDTVLQSPAVFSNKEGLEDIKLAHAEQLTQMRLPDKTIQLKSLNESQSVIIRKRKLRQNSCEESNSETKIKIRENDVKLKPLRDIIAYCVLPPKDEKEGMLNQLILNAVNSLWCRNRLLSILQQWNWDGEKFQMKVEKMRFAQQLSELVKSVTDVGQDDACS
ncbi:MAP kinase-activated protein kinase 5-like [Crassostrea virginica]|uniref:non-specific serine/threonine protein kinase n=1 Tax=Crassostrea virginica TaxID=6565 RepID=A0A8B8A605_CRAVI|nr:MAP kinase-activated protein kinase 5-like [Crassostrea virginica]